MLSKLDELTWNCINYVECEACCYNNFCWSQLLGHPLINTKTYMCVRERNFLYVKCSIESHARSWFGRLLLDPACLWLMQPLLASRTRAVFIPILWYMHFPILIAWQILTWCLCFIFKDEIVADIEARIAAWTFLPVGKIITFFLLI